MFYLLLALLALLIVVITTLPITVSGLIFAFLLIGVLFWSSWDQEYRWQKFTERQVDRRDDSWRPYIKTPLPLPRFKEAAE